MGFGGFKTLTFQIFGAGEGNLHLYYARSWEIEAALKNNEDVSSSIEMVIPVKAKHAVNRCV